MAHIPDGVLSIPVLAVGAAVTVAGVAIGLRRLEPDRIPQVAVLSAVFFVASLVHLPAGASSVHLMLNGLMGLALGAAAFPAILVALLLQAVLFGYGGLVVLGVNAMNMALPALLAGLAFRLVWRSGDGLDGDHRRAAWAAGAAAALAVAATAGLVALSLAASGAEFLPAARLVGITMAPVAVVEAFFTAAAVGLVVRVKPELLGKPA